MTTVAGSPGTIFMLNLEILHTRKTRALSTLLPQSASRSQLNSRSSSLQKLNDQHNERDDQQQVD